MLTKSQVWICSMCCLGAFASRLVHIHMWVTRSSLSSWLWSSFLCSDFTEFALSLQTPPNSISSPSGQCLFVGCVCCGTCGCADAGAPEAVSTWWWSQSSLVQTWYRLAAGRQRVHATGFPWCWFVQPSHLSLQSRCSQISARAGWGWTVESNSVIQ